MAGNNSAWNAWNDESTASERGDDGLVGGGDVPRGLPEEGVPQSWGPARELTRIESSIFDPH